MKENRRKQQAFISKYISLLDKNLQHENLLSLEELGFNKC
jgi:hypothetical protein